MWNNHLGKQNSCTCSYYMLWNCNLCSPSSTGAVASWQRCWIHKMNLCILLLYAMKFLSPWIYIHIYIIHTTGTCQINFHACLWPIPSWACKLRLQEQVKKMLQGTTHKYSAPNLHDKIILKKPRISTSLSFHQHKNFLLFRVRPIIGIAENSI